MQILKRHSILAPLCFAAAVASMIASAYGAAQSLSGQALVSDLRRGGYVLVMRHASSPQTLPTSTTAATGNAKLERQLDDNGHKTAEAMGVALRRLRVPVGFVLSSPTFRALETVKDLGLVNPQTFNELGDGGQGMAIPSPEAAKTFLRAKAAEPPRVRTNILIVTHLPNMQDAFGDTAKDAADGEVFVFRPDRRNANFVGRITIDEWPRLAGLR